jgi:hypothetical protein
MQFFLVTLIIVPIFIVFVLYFISSLTELNEKWEANVKRRKSRRAGNNVRLRFDAAGKVTRDTKEKQEHQLLWEELLGYLHELAPFSVGSMDLMTYREALQSAMELADELVTVIHTAVSKPVPDAQLIQTLTDTEDLLSNMNNREKLDADIVDAVFERFEADLERINDLKLSAIKTPEVALLEPDRVATGIMVRRSGILRMAVEFRDKYDIGSRRLILALVAIILTAGLVRFLGYIPAIVVGVVLILEIMLDFLRLCEHSSMSGFAATVKGASMVGRLAVPVLVVVAAVNVLLIGTDVRPRTNEELRNKGTFVEPPPFYNLGKSLIQTYYVPFIYGIYWCAHICLLLAPLPLCYRLQALLVRCCPTIRFIVPDNPVWLHRMLGFSMLGGVIIGGVVWVFFQGMVCSVLNEEFACLAFDPVPGTVAGKAFRLRFLVVMPWSFFFLPLLASSKYPEVQDPTTKKGKDGYTPLGAAEAEDDESADDGEKELTAATCIGKYFRLFRDFFVRRIVEICLLVVPIAGIILMIKLRSPFFFWFLVLPLVLAHLIVKFRAVSNQLPSWIGCLARKDEGPQLFQRFWWEIAYASHATAFSVVLAFTLVIRFEVFGSALFTWALYFIDRFLGLRAACRNSADIVVHTKGLSSYVVSRDKDGKSTPSHIRLLLQKPPGFEYNAGQWAHLAFHNAGTYWCAPRCFTPGLQWHPLSIASCEEEDYLEFHIQVCGNFAFAQENDVVSFSASEERWASISRKDRILERCIPWHTPLKEGVVSEENYNERTDCVVEEASGATLKLKAVDGGEEFKVLKPQMQWTGKLWNFIHWRTEMCAKGQDLNTEKVHLMGPYGTFPWVFKDHRAAMLIGAGVGFPSMGAMLRKALLDNLLDIHKPDQQKKVCFVWTASKLEQLLLCFPLLVADLTKYVHNANREKPGFGLANLKNWLTIKIFISSFEVGDDLPLNPSPQQLADAARMASALAEVQRWLLGGDADIGGDNNGTYIAQGSLGGSFNDIIRNSKFMENIVFEQRSLGICFCGPQELCSWLRSDIANTIFPIKVEFSSEVA